MNKSIKMSIGLFVFLVAFSSCNKLDLEKDVPNCIEQKIREIQKESVQNPTATVWEWVVDGTTYYYIPSDCCDQFNYLFDDNCNEVCAPDGGFTGSGDGKCPTFKGQIVKTLIWEDDRN